MQGKYDLYFNAGQMDNLNADQSRHLSDFMGIMNQIEEAARNPDSAHTGISDTFDGAVFKALADSYFNLKTQVNELGARLESFLQQLEVRRQIDHHVHLYFP